MLELAEEKRSPTVIKVLGVGGAGMNAVNRMISAGLQGVEFIVINTDEQVLLESSASHRISIGQETTRGMGAGGDPEIGHRSAMEDQARIQQAVRGADMVFITAGMGGGTGTGAAPIVAEAARKQGALVIGVVTLPFLRIEGQRRMSFAQKGLEALRDKVDTLIIIRNDSIFKVVDPKTSVDIAFRMIDDILLNAVRGVSDLINTAGLVNVDFADVRSIMGEKGEAVMGAGEGVGEERAAKAVNQAIHNALLEESGIEGAKAALINVCGGENLGIFELKDVTELITKHVDPQANIIIGLSIDPSLGERLRVTVIATGFEKKRIPLRGQERRKSALGKNSHNPYYLRPMIEEQKEEPPSVLRQPQSQNAISDPPHKGGAREESTGLLQSLSQEEYAALQDFSSTDETETKKEEAVQKPLKKAVDLENPDLLDIPAYLRRKK